MPTVYAKEEGKSQQATATCTFGDLSHVTPQQKGNPFLFEICFFVRIVCCGLQRITQHNTGKADCLLNTTLSLSSSNCESI